MLWTLLTPPSPTVFLCRDEYTGAQLAVWDRWVNGCVEMGLLWTGEMGGERHSLLPTATGQTEHACLSFVIFSSSFAISLETACMLSVHKCVHNVHLGTH